MFFVLYLKGEKSYLERLLEHLTHTTDDTGGYSKELVVKLQKFINKNGFDSISIEYDIKYNDNNNTESNIYSFIQNSVLYNKILSFKDVKEEKNQKPAPEIEYCFGHRYYYWIFYRYYYEPEPFNKGYLYSDFYVYPRFNSFKQEIINGLLVLCQS